MIHFHRRVLQLLMVALCGAVWSAAAQVKSKQSEGHALQGLDIPDLKSAEVCLATTQEASGDKMDWLITCLDGKRRYIVREKRMATEKSAGEDEMTYGDLEITVEMQNRGFRLASTQDGLFFVRK